MDKNKIKSFAVWARRSLIASVSDKANRIGIYEDRIDKAIEVQGGFKLEGKEDIFPISKSHRDVLENQVREKGFMQVMEEAAYTWFNRFMGLRYMEVNDYLPSGIRILSSEIEGKKEPDVLTKISEVIDELGLDVNEIYELLDTGDTLDREKAYRTILVKKCNELGKIIPQMFEKISDYTELLLPDNLLEDGSVLRKMVEDIEEKDWKEEVEIIGWMYQYYISEKKDEVFSALKKNIKITKENIPAATQLFTPKWIVKYMMENSLGRLWLEGHPNEELQKGWKYYLEEAEQKPEVEEELKKIREEHSKLRPEDIKVLDPCMGSGHILVYAFDVLYEIYKTAGYPEREIPRLILQNNLYGLDVDDRAAQLASFALIMKARHYNRRLFREIERERLELNLCSIQESNGINEEQINYFCSLNTDLDNDELRQDLEYLVNVFADAKEYGSILEVEEVDFNALKQRLKEIENDDNLMFGDYRKMLLDKLPMLIKQGEIMSRLYEICVTNPPYMGSSGMSQNVSNFVKEKYPNGRNDLFSCFMEKVLFFLRKDGLTGLMTSYTWMFLNAFSSLREEIIDNSAVCSLVQPEYHSFFQEAFVPICTFVLRNSKLNYNGKYIRLEKFRGAEQQSIKTLEAIENNNCEYLYAINQKEFSKIPNQPFSYWLSSNLIEMFKSTKSLSEYSDLRQGLITGDNEKFLRCWYECVDGKITHDKIKPKKWFFYHKGGEYRKWYGNITLVVNWENEGHEICNFKNDNGKLRSRPQNVKYYLQEGFTWTALTVADFNVRFMPEGAIFDAKGSSGFCKNYEQLLYIIALCNSKPCMKFLEILSPTMDYNAGAVSKIPTKFSEKYYKGIVTITKENIDLVKNEWNLYEISCDFKTHPLIKLLDKGKQHKLSDIFTIWETECAEAFYKLKQNEEELNRIFIDIYGLQDELTPEVEDKDITIRKADRERDIKSFISYAVGCMFGRYSIDAEGLIYAGGNFDEVYRIFKGHSPVDMLDKGGNYAGVSSAKTHYSQVKINGEWKVVSYEVDVDNVLPITEDEYFEDDIVSRFINFVKVVYGNDTLEENLDFISDSIGRKPSETARQAIRRYFIKDFYKDHLKIYQKRPIYWMFDSGKNDGFKVLVYMHRYNEQTIAKVRTDYLHTLQRKYEAEINRLELVVDSEEYTAKDRAAAKKKIDRISKQIEECREYDQVVGYLANEKIAIDLDDGVKVNYAKFQDIKMINAKGNEIEMSLLSKI